MTKKTNEASMMKCEIFWKYCIQWEDNMVLEIRVSKIKSIRNFYIEIPVEKGLYVITGENASGKSTVLACAASAFFQFPMNKYFGKPSKNAYIECRYGDAIRRLEYNENWKQHAEGKFLKGFYEGSIIYGNRFRDVTFQAISKYDEIEPSDLVKVHPFIINNFGEILKNDKNAYSEMYKLNQRVAREKYNFSGEPYCYLREGKYIFQGFMSTGENLLVTILHSLFQRIGKRGINSLFD